jgi:GTP-binding protein
LRQARVALDRSAHIIFLIDGRAEITGADRELARMLRQLGKPVALAVNKIDSASRESLAHEFYALGFSDLFPISAEHRLGIDDLLDHVTGEFPRDSEGERQATGKLVKVAIIGRPNVGKSTLLNALVGQDRAIVSPIAGTTRDAVDEAVTREGTEYVFVDTAGIRRKGKTHLMAEKLSVVMARKHIRMANVALLVLDATQGVIALDATIGGYVVQEGRGVLLCVNKWDAIADRARNTFLDEIRDQLKFLDYAPVAFISAKTGAGVKKLFSMVREIYDSASYRVTTGELNRFVESLALDSDVKIKYITQASVRPPAFVLFTDRPKKLHFSTERFLMNRLRERFGFKGTPIVLKVR